MATIGCVLTLSLATGAVALSNSRTAELFFRDIKITLNGSAISPKDANGNTVEPFIIDGTTYLPVRAVADAMGLDVSWDDATNTVVLKDKRPQGTTKTEYHTNDTWTVPGQWSLTITGVTETDDRNPYSDKTPAAVYVVDYTYTNLGYDPEDSFSDGLFMTIDDTIIDSAGSMGYSYPGDQTYYAQRTPVGATCQAQEVIGVDHAGTFKLTVSKYDGNREKQNATFVVDVP